MKNADDAAPATEQHTNARDMNSIRRRNYGRVGGHACTMNHSPPNTSDSEFESEGEDEDDRSTSQSRPCICQCMGCLGRVLATHSLAGDLAGHMFGHLVSTELAREILTTFVINGFVQVFEGVVIPGDPVPEDPIDPHSGDKVQRAVQQAFEAAVAHDCIRLPLEGNAPEERSPSPDQEEEEETIYLFKWCTFPKESGGGDELVSFLNDITDRAFAVAKSQCTTMKLELQHRFATPKNHAVPLAYGLDEDVMRPDFFLLPIEAFSDAGFKTVDENYINFTALRLVGGFHKEHPRVGLEQMQQYAEGLKWAQPWVHYVLGMTISQNMTVFSRGDSSGWEHLALMLWDGRGSIEFIRILLGLAIADAVDLGQNPDIELKPEIHMCKLHATSPDSHLDAARSDDAASATSCHSVPTTPHQKPVEKRHHSEIEKEDDSEEDPGLKKLKITEANNSAEPFTSPTPESRV